MAPTNGSRKGSKQPEFPPRWVGNALDTLFATARHTVVALVAYAAYAGGREVWALHQSGRLAPVAAQHLSALQAAAAAMPPGVLLAATAAALLLAALLAVVALRGREKPIYLLDFECYRPEPCNRVTYRRFVQGSTDAGFFDAESMAFQEKLLMKSALSDETFFPPGLHKDPPVFDMNWAREEAELVMFNAVEDLLKKTGLSARQVDVLVTNCSLFNPTPSLSAMIINRFGMRSDIDSYNLAGMGCSAGVIATGLARKLLRERSSGGYALVVSTENITQNWYRGNERSMLVPNTIFRMGSAAVMLTSKRSERRRAKYELQHVVRVHLGADEDAYRCIFQKPDDAGRIGVELSKELVKVASKAMTVNMTRLGPLVLPWSEKLMFAANWVARKALGMQVAPYVPDFRKVFDHFCLHAGGRGVVEGLSKQLNLPADKMAPSANALYWYGNTSSSTVWYSFGFAESVQGVRRGDNVWQIGFGSGFKCNSAVWRALRNNNTVHKAWKHVEGREGEALATLQRIAAESAAERAAKQQQEQPAGKQQPQDHPVTAAPAAQENAGRLANGHTGAAAAAEGGRALRNGKVLPYVAAQ